MVMMDASTPIRTTGKDVEREENEEAEVDRETRREDAVTTTGTTARAMIDGEEDATTTETTRGVIVVGKNIECNDEPIATRLHTKPRETAMDLAPEVLRVLAAHIEEDVLSGNHDLVKPQRITFVRASASSSTSSTLISISASLLALVFTATLFLCGALAVALALAYANKRAVSKRFNAWARERVLDELRKRTTSACELKSMTVTRKGVTLKGLVIGNASNGGTYKSSHLARIEEIRIAMDFFSACGRLQFGNLIFGFVTTRLDEIFVSGASVNVEENAGMKNYDIMRRAPAEGEVTESKEVPRVMDGDDKLASGGGFFSGFTDSLEASKRAIDAQMQEAMKLPGAVAGSLKNAGTDVTKRLYALASILERLKRSTPLDNEEEKNLDVLRLRRAPMVLRVNNLTLYNWSLCITTVADSPFQFRLFEVNDFIGTPGALGKKVAIGVINEIMNDFHRKMFGNIADGVGNVASGIFDAGTFVVGGVTSGVGSAVNAVGSGLNTVTTAVVTGTSRY